MFKERKPEEKVFKLSGEITLCSFTTFGEESKQNSQNDPNNLVSLNGLVFDLDGDRAKPVGDTNRQLNQSFLEHLEGMRETGVF